MSEIIGRPPIEAVEAEKATLGAMLIDEEAIVAAVQFLTPADFYRVNHQWLFAFIAERFARNEPVDSLSIAFEVQRRAMFEGAGEYVLALVQECPSSANLMAYAEPVWNAAQFRRVLVNAEVLTAKAHNPETTVDELRALAEAQVHQLGDGPGVGARWRNMRELGSEAGVSPQGRSVRGSERPL